MRFFRSAVYVLFALSFANLAFNLYMYKELRETNVIVAPNPEVKTMHDYSVVRDTQILQGVLMVHHKLAIHPPGQQQLCPICDEMKKDSNNNIITVQQRH